MNDMKRKLQERIMYHKDHMRDCEDHARGVWEMYEAETRKGLDEKQLQTLLVWRKEEIAKVNALRECHHYEKSWLSKLLSEIDE